MPPVRRTDSDRVDAVVPFQDHPVAPLDTPWSFDGADAQALLGDDQDFDRLRKAYLWWDAETARARGNPIIGDFKLPFAKLIDGKIQAVWNGLTSAVAAINGARQKPDIPADQLRGAFNHALRYYAKINKDLEDEEKKAIPEFKGDVSGNDGAHEEEEEERDDSGLKREWRKDRVPFLRPSMRMDDGRLMLQAFIAKPGILTYRLADGREVRELITAAELHDPVSLRTLGQAPVTLEHPRVDVDSDNVKELAIGNVGDVVTIADDGFIKVNMVIRRADGISAVQSRDKGETSPGYTTLIDPTPGVDPEFGRYDAIQRGRRYNHVAVTEAARGGHDIKLRADSGIQILPPSDVPVPPTVPVPEATMHLRLMPLLLSSLALMGMERTDADALIKPLGDLKVDRADANSVNAADTLIMDTLRSAFDKMSGAYQTLKGEHDALVAANKKAKDEEHNEEDKHDAFMVMHTDRLALEVLAKANDVDPASADIRKLDNAGLRKAVAMKLNPAMKADSSDDYVRAYIDAHAKLDTRADAWAAHSTEDVQVPRADDVDDRRADAGKKPPTSPAAAHRRAIDSAFADAQPKGN